MESKEVVLKKLKEMLKELKVEYSKIIMFGSRARGDFGEESDWDFLIVLKKPADARTRREIWLKIYKKFHEHFPLVSVDIILKDAASFEEEKAVANTISNEVFLEGVEI